MRKTKTLTQCLALQDLIHDAALTFKTSVQMKDGAPSMDVKTAVALSRLAIAWNAIAERARILRGRPLPGSLKPERSKHKPRPFWPPTLPTDDVQPLPSEPLKGPDQSV